VVIKLSLLLVIGLSYVFAGEYESGMIKLLKPTPNGRKKLFRLKLAAAALYALVAAAAVYIPEYMIISKTLPLEYWNAPAQSMSFLYNAPAHMPIWAYFALILILRFVGLAAAVFLIFAVGTAVKRGIAAMVVSSALLIIPAAVSAIGVKTVTRFSLLPAMTGTMALKPAFSLQTGGIYQTLAMTALPFAAAVFCYLYTKRNFCR